jgi:uncharacterized membrane protein
MTKISVQKGSMSMLSVLIGFAVAVGAEALAKAVGVDIPVVTQEQATVAITAAVAGVITGGLNWWKHRSDKPAIEIPKV